MKKKLGTNGEFRNRRRGSGEFLDWKRKLALV